MGEAADSLRNVLSNQKLAEIPNKELTFSTLRSLVKTFHELSPTERDGVELFIEKSIKGSSGGSLGAFGKGEAASSYEILSKRTADHALKEIEQTLEQAGTEFRLPLAVVKSILQQRSPYKGFENIKMGVSPNVIDFSLCPEAEGKLYDAMQFKGATIVTFDNEPFMIAKLHEAYGKSVGLPLKSIGPFVEGILYSPGVVLEDSITQARREIDFASVTTPFNEVATIWYIGRPVSGKVPPVLSPYVEQKDAMKYFQDNITRYPFSNKPSLEY